jgi:hypothetical protein
MQQQLGDTTMFKNGKIALIVAITLSVLGSSSAAFAVAKDDDGGGGAGGFVIRGSMDAQSPARAHRKLFRH